MRLTIHCNLKPHVSPIIFLLPSVLQGFEYPSGTGGARGLEWRWQVSHYPGPFHHLTWVFRLEESQIITAEATWQCPANQVTYLNQHISLVWFFLRTPLKHFVWYFTVGFIYILIWFYSFHKKKKKKTIYIQKKLKKIYICKNDRHGVTQLVLAVVFWNHDMVRLASIENIWFLLQ